MYVRDFPVPATPVQRMPRSSGDGEESSGTENHNISFPGRRMKMRAQKTESHPSKRVKVGNMEADIDVMLVPLIREMWKAGIETEECCQDLILDEEKNIGKVFISFPNIREIRDFLSIISDNRDIDKPESLYRRILGCSEEQNIWSYDIFLEDGGLMTKTGNTDFEFASCVLFSQSDIKEATRRLRNYNIYRKGAR